MNRNASLCTHLIVLFMAIACHIRASDAQQIALPEVIPQGGMSLDSALATRRSVREFAREAVSLDDVSCLLWAGQGVTNESGYRTAPSAGGLYPIDLYLFAGDVVGLDRGVYRYVPDMHTLEIVSYNDIRGELAAAALDQEWVRDASLAIIVTGVPERTYVKYGERAWRYVLIESGCVVQNILLQSTNLHLASVIVGAFLDDKIRPLIGLPSTNHPLAIISAGKYR